jgi:hypothetical protein
MNPVHIPTLKILSDTYNIFEGPYKPKETHTTYAKKKLE